MNTIITDEFGGIKCHSYSDIKKLFVERLPRNPYCSDIKTYMHIRTKDIAIKEPYLQHNPPAYVHSMTFDIDRQNGAYAYEELDLPPPNFATINKDNGHAHLSYLIASPVGRYGNNGTKPIRYLAAIEYSYKEALRADAGFVGLLMKNPLHEKWRTQWNHYDLFDLHELADNVDLQTPPRERETSGLGRNCHLFDEIRYYAYSRVGLYRSTSTYQRWLEHITRQAETINRDLFSNPMMPNEVSHIAKSIAHWTFFKYRGDGKQRGVMGLDSRGIDLSPQDRKSLGAKYTADLKRERTELRIRDAIATLESGGQRVTKSAVAKMTNMNRQHISSEYGHLFHSEKVSG